MSTRKSFDRVCIAVLTVSLLLTALFMNGAALGLESAAHTLGYESRLFDTSRVHTLSIVMDDWEGFLENCENEEYAACSVVIDNESYKNVGLRAKGNTSLSSVRSMDSQRYSMKIEFDHYETGKTYHGLDKLCLNNIIQDNTYMKDYLTYRMMGEFGADAPLCSYVWITVNGKDWGLYLAVEGVEDAFLQRNYGSDYGDLYKPDSQSFGGGGPGRGRDFRMSEFMNEWENANETDSDSATDETNNATSGNSANDSGVSDNSANGSGDSGATNAESASRRRNGMRGMGGDMPFPGNMTPPDGMQFPDMGNMTPPDGAQFPDMDGMTPPDFPGDMGDSFPGIDSTGGFGSVMFPAFGNENGGRFPGGGMRGMGSDDVKLKYTDDDPDSYSSIFGNAKTDVTAADKTRLIASLKSLAEKENLENVVDIDEVLRYFTVHNYVVNGDSYTGGMIHNYYLYEKDGRLSMIPWDYNLAFGGFQGGNASSSVNDPIDTPLSVSGNGDRPMAEWFLQGTEYAELYHAYFREFLATVDAGRIIDDAYALIAPYVERDPTKFCAYEDFEKGVAALRTFCELRKRSVAGQLDGSIPSASDGQTEDTSALIDASGLTLSDMGNMGFGGGRGGFGGRNARNGAASETPDGAASETPDAPQAVEANATTDDGANESDAMQFPGGMNGAFPGGGFGGAGGFPGGGFGVTQSGAASLDSFSMETWVLLGVSCAILFAGLLTARFFGNFYRRKA